MFKYLISFVLLVGCGAPQTPAEVKADNLLSEFVADCKSVYGERCDIPMVVHSLSDSEDGQTCWSEEGNPIRQVVLNKEVAARSDRAAAYKLFFKCSLNLGTLQSNLSVFEEFATTLGLMK